MGAFSGMRDAKMYERGTPLTAGKYSLEIEKCLLKDTRKSGLAFIVEFRVLASSEPVKHPVGSKRTWFQKMQDKDVAFGSIKGFAAAVAGVPTNDLERIKREIEPEIENTMDAAVGVDNALAGQRVNVEVVLTKTKKNEDFSRHNWEPYATAA